MSPGLLSRDRWNVSVKYCWKWISKFYKNSLTAVVSQWWNISNKKCMRQVGWILIQTRAPGYNGKCFIKLYCFACYGMSASRFYQTSPQFYKQAPYALGLLLKGNQLVVLVVKLLKLVIFSHRFCLRLYIYNGYCLISKALWGWSIRLYLPHKLWNI